MYRVGHFARPTSNLKGLKVLQNLAYIFGLSRCMFRNGYRLRDNYTQYGVKQAEGQGAPMIVLFLTEFGVVWSPISFRKWGDDSTPKTGRENVWNLPSRSGPTPIVGLYHRLGIQLRLKC